MLAQKLLSSMSGAEETLYVDDVFSAYTYTGNGSTQTINNGIDLAGKGGMVWLKARNLSTVNHLYDTARSSTKYLASNLTDAEATDVNGLTAFTSSGFSVGSSSPVNFNTYNYVSWTFRRSAKFFDVVTYTGNGSINRAIAHSLGITPGMIIVKKTNSTSDWSVYHRSLSAPVNEKLLLNITTTTGTYSGMWGQANTSTTFGVSEYGATNDNGSTYVAYLFAHDSSADGIVQCGSFTVSGGTSGQVNLGWEPQYLLVKSSNTVQDWMVVDTTRKMALTEYAFLRPNTAGPETVGANASFAPNATGFTSTGYFADGTVLTYLAIRRPNKPPTVGTQVYQAIARTGTGAAATVTGVGFAPDLAIYINRPHNAISNSYESDRLRGPTKTLATSTTGGEQTFTTAVTSFDMDGMTLGTDAGNNLVNGNTYSYINYFFKRAPGVFDQVCYTASPSRTNQAHSLGVVPELVIVKQRNGADAWYVASSANLTIGGFTVWQAGLVLNTTAASSAGGSVVVTSNANVTATTINNIYGYGSNTFVAYLFASKAGISKITSFVGNGTSQTIDCGFTTGARFVMIKATSTTGDWLVGDSTRGLVAGNDPRLSLNSPAAEVTTEDWLDPHSSGFIVNQVAGSSANASGVSYIVLAFA